MRIETNETLVKRNKAWSGRLFIVTLVVIIASFFLLNSPFLTEGMSQDNVMLVSLVLPAVLLPIAFIATVFSIRMTNMWVRQPRPERMLEDNLKGLGKSAVLYNFYHFPARHVLVTQAGVMAMVTRFQDGKYRATGDKWSSARGAFNRVLSIMRMDGIGSPSLDAQVAAQHVDKLLSDINPDVPVYPVVLLIDPRAEFEVTEPTVAVLHISTRRSPNLKEWVKALPKSEHALTPEQITEFENRTLHGKK